MAGKAIFRISKLKSFVAIAGAERHNYRLRSTPNADSQRRQDNFTFMGDAERPLLDLARERIGEQKIRKNALLAIEVFISASPEYFRPDAPERAGYWEQEKFATWLAANATFLEQEFGSRRILRAECHLDESTPHIHAVIVPLTDQGKLSYRQLYGGKRTQLSELQDRAWLAVADLGIERGRKGSQAQHQTVQSWYAEIQQPLGPELDAETVRVKLLDRVRLERENGQLKQQAAALSQTLEKRNQEKQALLQQSTLMQKQLQIAQAQIATWQERYGDLLLQKEDDLPRFEPPIAMSENWDKVRADLVALQLPGKLIDALHEQRLLYADNADDLVFLQRDFQTQAITGAYVHRQKGVSEMVLGSEPSLGRFYWLRGGKAIDRVQRVVVGQTPLDALAIGLMKAEPKVRTMYLSADGALPIEYLRSFSAKQIRMAFNQDAMGQQLAAQARVELPDVKHIHPEQANWVQSLQVVRRRELQQRLRSGSGKEKSAIEMN
jgi:hypothetical protein